MKYEQINIVFKQTFKAFIAEFFNCGSFENAVNTCETYNDLNNVLKSYSSEIKDALSSPFDECDECSEKDTEIDNLESEIKDLEKARFSNLHDEMKHDCFLKNHEKFNLTEFEQIMSNNNLA